MTEGERCHNHPGTRVAGQKGEADATHSMSRGEGEGSTIRWVSKRPVKATERLGGKKGETRRMKR